MNETQPLGDFLWPYIISQFIALFILVSAIKGWLLTRWLLAIMFVYAGVYNFYIGINDPDEYLNFRHYAVPLYERFIDGAFRKINHILIPLIAAGQLFIGIGFTMGGKWYKYAAIGSTIFLLAISPLLFGAAFPFSLTVIVAIWVGFERYDRLSLWQSRRHTQNFQ